MQNAYGIRQIARSVNDGEMTFARRRSFPKGIDGLIGVRVLGGYNKCAGQR